LTTMPERWTRAADMASRSAGVEARGVALLHEGALGHQYLPQVVSRSPAGGDRRRRWHRGSMGGVLPVGDAEPGDRDGAEHHGDRRDALHPFGVARRILEVRVGEAGDGDGHRRAVRFFAVAVGRGSDVEPSSARSRSPSVPASRVSLVPAHLARSPIQKQMRRGCPHRRGARRSPHRPARARRADAPCVVRVLDGRGDVAHDVAHLGVGQVSGESGACWRARCDGLGTSVGVATCSEGAEVPKARRHTAG